jgi:hypothetical protein
MLDIEKKTYIQRKLRDILSNLNQNEFDKLFDIYEQLLVIIYIKFGYNGDIFWYQITQNNDRDLLSILNMLLPYIDDDEGKYTYHKNIEFIKDISCKKINTVDRSINPFIISNIQFTYNNKYDNEYEYSIDDIQHNMILLLETIDKISNKLYVNWLDILPYDILTYKETDLYKNSVKFNKSKGKFLSDDDEIELNNIGLFIYKGISLNDIFDTIYYYLYYDIVKIKWLLYVDTFNDRISNYYTILKDCFIDGIEYNIKWDLLSEEKQRNFENKFYLFFDKNNKGYTLFLYNFLIFFEFNYKFINSIVKKYDYTKITDDFSFGTNQNFFESNLEFDFFQPEDNKDPRHDLSIIQNKLKQIPIEFIYDYILESIQHFKTTYYGRKIIEFNQNNIDYKLYYNYAKGL